MIQRLVLKYSKHRSRNSLTQKRRNLLWYLKELDKLIDERVPKYGELWMKERKVQAIKKIEEWLKESEMQTQKSLVSEGAALEASLVSEGATLEASLVIKGAALEASLVTEGIALDENSVARQCIVDSRNDADADIRPSYDSDKVYEVHHDTFENVFAHRIQNHEQPKFISDTYVVNENNSNIIYDIPHMDPDRAHHKNTPNKSILDPAYPLFTYTPYAQLVVEMDDPNITMEEYIRLEEEKAQSYAEFSAIVFGKTSTTLSDTKQGMIMGEYNTEREDSEIEFPAILFNNTPTSEATHSYEPTDCSYLGLRKKNCLSLKNDMSPRNK
uniref:Uncharacterized protein n=1 Tax=Tanacetum cinerariifolium TaxID=118510 RepID=A0A699GG53_TANCI|nr:hypothetical protein [Tanacetum cinerariifolium]